MQAGCGLALFFGRMGPSTVAFAAAMLYPRGV